jgi:DNA recombination protein RmuC
MTDILIIIAVVLGIANLAVLFTRKPKEPKDYKADFERLTSDTTRLETSFREEIRASRAESQAALKSNREELSVSLEKIRETMETRLRHIQSDSAEQLDKMRKTVDEKLQESVEKRFNESFKLISERLDQVHKGLGEMQSLAVGVGDLKKVLSNVKTRGNLGEIQLGAILEQMLSREQYDEQVSVKSGAERVDFAVKLPGSADDKTPLYLPIDAKFPIEDFRRLQEAYDTGEDVDGTSKRFEDAVKKNAKDISGKYINPPVTTDFAIMFVPTEGLYAEILRRPGLFETLQRDHRITVVGPSNLAAFLSSLQMGFRTLAIEKHSSEVWNLLGAVKTEFDKFGEVVDSAQRSLAAATNHLEKLGTRSRAIGKQLRNVEVLPQNEAAALIEDLEE